MRPASALAPLCAACAVAALLLRATPPAQDRASRDEPALALPPPVAGVPLNRPKSATSPGAGGSVVNVSQLAGNEAEVTLDVNPADPGNIVILGHSPSLQVINSFCSLDGGESWTRVTIGDADDGLAGWLRGDPSVAFDDDGNVYLAYGIRRRSPDRVTVVVARSLDGGRSYTRFTQVTTDPDIGAYPGNDKWHLATGPRYGSPDQTNVYLAGTRNVEEAGEIDQRIVIARSLDRGETFSAPVIVNDSSLQGASLANTSADPAVGPDGDVYVAWWNIITRGLYVDHSLSGQVFGSDVLITTTQTGAFTPIPAQPSRGVFAGLSIDTDRSQGPYRGRLYAVYTDLGAGGVPDIDVFVRHSGDLGATWSPRSRANDDDGTGSQFLPWLDVDRLLGTVGVSFYDTRNDPLHRKVELFVAPSHDGGETFGANLAMSAGASDQSADNPHAWAGNYLEYTGLALHDGTAYAVWSDNSTDPADLDFFHGRVALAAPSSVPGLAGLPRGLLRFDAPSPNPARTGTRFSFHLAGPSAARVAIYDASGRAVRWLTDEERRAGERRVEWDGRDGRGRPVPPGIYLCRLDAGGASATRKLVVAR